MASITKKRALQPSCSSDVQEVPVQDFTSIQREYLAKLHARSLSSEDLYVDPVFPPDLSSLTYVYSGDDKYEDMVFCRPKELCDTPCLVGEQGVSGLRLPLCRWNDRQWFLYALAVVSLSPQCLENVIPGYKQHLQNFQDAYTGCFQFRLWRFGSWVEVVVDDTLPVLYGHLAYCPASGSQPEFWAPLVEKAYAKIKKAYEAIELGDTLNALADLTGAVCEHYSPEGPSTLDLFHILFKSSIYRSLVVCRRTLRSYRGMGTGFRQASLSGKIAYAKTKSDCCISYVSDVNQDFEDTGENCLYVITTATKFPLRDGRLFEMLRMKNPYENSVTWQGEFSVGNENSWHQVNPGFMENYRPKDCLGVGEFWISFLDFQKHFSDLVICSSPQPHSGISHISHPKVRQNSFAKHSNGNNVNSVVSLGRESVDTGHGNSSFLDVPVCVSNQKRGSIEITVSESGQTVKVDTVATGHNGLTGNREFTLEACHHRRSRSAKESSTLSEMNALDRPKKHSVNYNNVPKAGGHRNREEVLESSSSKAWVFPVRRKVNVPPQSEGATTSRHNSVQSAISIFSGASVASNTSVGSSTSGVSSMGHGADGSASIFSNLSACGDSAPSSVSDSESTNSVSEIQVKVRSHKKGKKQKNHHSASLPNLNKEIDDSEISAQAKSSMFESHMDYFRPNGAWRMIVSTFGCWTESSCGGPPTDIVSHSRNPRILFSIPKPDSVLEVIPANLRGKCHVLISLLQDYRQGSNTANSMLVRIGFSLYRVKNAEKDEKRRNLGKLTKIADVRSQFECREVTARFDLDPGWYLMVPFTIVPGHIGEFLTRILGEKDRISAKTACAIS